MIADAILFAGEAPVAFDWNRLGEHLPYEWIEAALAEHGKASIRRRRLPAQQVVWLVIALALYRHRSVADVVAELDLALPDMTLPIVSDGAVTRARHPSGFVTSAMALSNIRACLDGAARAKLSLRRFDVAVN